MPSCEPILLPSSFAELLDRLSILAIKSERISDPVPLTNVRAELSGLQAEWDRIAPMSSLVDGALSGTFRALKSVNERIWDAEERIRALDAAGDFGPEFVRAAQAIYRTNDRHAEIKRGINLATGSAIVEEKSYRHAF